ncbi:MAG: hypothetical protein ACXWP0_00365 [Ktedonobacterales bacterium]
MVYNNDVESEVPVTGYWYNNHSASEAQFWSGQPAREAYMLHMDTVVQTTVYESPTRPYWYSLTYHAAGTFGSLYFETALAAYEQLIRNLDAQIGALADRREAAAVIYEEMVTAEVAGESFESFESCADTVQSGVEGRKSPQPQSQGADHRA